jgi:hypothetical protein
MSPEICELVVCPHTWDLPGSPRLSIPASLGLVEGNIRNRSVRSAVLACERKCELPQVRSMGYEVVICARLRCVCYPSREIISHQISTAVVPLQVCCAVTLQGQFVYLVATMSTTDTLSRLLSITPRCRTHWLDSRVATITV